MGVITGAVLKLFARPTARVVAWVGAASLTQLVTLSSELRARCGERLTAFEMMSAPALALVLAHVLDTRAPLAAAHAVNALIELSDTDGAGLLALLENTLEQALADGVISDASLPTSQTQSAALWKLREGISQAQVRAGKVVKHDIALPISALADFVAKADEAVHAAAQHFDIAIINFGHLGDGNLHYNVLMPADVSAQTVNETTLLFNRVVHDLVATFNGSISAEHGVGQLRRDELKHYKSPLELEMMMCIKRAFDPNQIMNPGKLL